MKGALTMSRKQDLNTEAETASELAAAVERLTDEVHVLRQAVDDLREELLWELRQLRSGAESKPPFRLASMPLDPLAPDFHQRVNAIDPRTLAESPPAEPTDLLSSFIGQLMSDAPTEELAAEDWVEDQEFTPGEVVVIDPAMADWFEQYLVVVKRDAQWLMLDDGEGWFYLLWRRDEQCYVRLLTEEQQAEITRLTGLSPDAEWRNEDSPAREPSPVHAEPPQSTQRSLF
jgi:hypothetical protein